MIRLRRPTNEQASKTKEKKEMAYKVNRYLYAMVDSFSKTVVTVKRMSIGEAMQANLIDATEHCRWQKEMPPDDYEWFGGPPPSVIP
jgi:hypothetical protein